jgi:osmoprotectant transport system ATP-binding protein
MDVVNGRGQSSDDIIALHGVGKRYGAKWGLRNVELRIQRGETVALLGPSGSGKTTCLRLINRLLEPTEGRVEVMGRDVADSDSSDLRRGIGYVIQDVGLFAHYSVEQNVAVVPTLLGWARARTEARVRELLELVGLPAGQYAARYPAELSGGQRQRVGIARALAADPPIVLLDEPFGALDPITREQLQEQFIELAGQLGKTFVLVTHDVVEAVRLAHRIAILDQGRLIQFAAAEAIVKEPASDLVRALFAPRPNPIERLRKASAS